MRKGDVEEEEEALVYTTIEQERRVVQCEDSVKRKERKGKESRLVDHRSQYGSSIRRLGIAYFFKRLGVNCLVSKA